jgi:hypothetical protein
MRKLPWLTLASISIAALASISTVRDARACGGCFHPPPPPPGSTQQPTVVTDHRMVVALSGDTTTLWDQIQYAGDPADFAWILPVQGGVAVGVGNARFIDALDQQTTPVIHSPQVICQYPPGNFAGGGGGFGGNGGAGCGCASSDSADKAGGFDLDSGTASGGAPDGGTEGVTVTSQESVGPYDVVTIHGTDTTSIVDWLTSHGYQIPGDIAPILDQYVAEGFDFVAVRLSPGKGVQAMQPIRVSWKGKDVSLPLRMVAAGVGDRVGIKLFVIGDGRWAVSNFYTFSLADDSLYWDFDKQRSDYTVQRDAISASHGYAAFDLEASIVVQASSLPVGGPPPSYDAGTSDAAGDGGDGGDAGDASPTDTGAPGIPPSESDVDVAFGTYTARRVTRLRGDIAASALSKDLVLQADVVQATRPIDYQLSKWFESTTACPGGGKLTGIGDPNPFLDAGAPGSMLQLDASASSSSGCATSGSSSPMRWSIAIAFGAIAAALVRRATRR